MCVKTGWEQWYSADKLTTLKVHYVSDSLIIQAVFEYVGISTKEWITCSHNLKVNVDTYVLYGKEGTSNNIIFFGYV